MEGGGCREVRERWREAAIMIVSFDYYVFFSLFFVRIGSVGVKWRRCLMKVLEPDLSEKCNTDTKTEVLIVMSASLEADIYHGRKKTFCHKQHKELSYPVCHKQHKFSEAGQTSAGLSRSPEETPFHSPKQTMRSESARPVGRMQEST